MQSARGLKPNGGSDIKSLYAKFLELCESGDKGQAIAVASILVDGFKVNGRLEEILELNSHFINTFREADSSTPYFLILKETIDSAIRLIESVETEEDLPTTDTATLICMAIIQLPNCYHDSDFMMSIVQRIANIYKSESLPKLLVMAHYTTLLQELFAETLEWFEGLTGISHIGVEKMAKHIEQHKKYESMLFNEETPRLVNGSPYELTGERKKKASHRLKIRELEDLAGRLFRLTDADLHLLPELRKQHESLLKYFADIASKEPFDEVEATYNMVICFTIWRKHDIDYIRDNVEPYAQKLLAFEPSNTISTRETYWVNTAINDLMNCYVVVGNDEQVYRCSIKYLRFSNHYLKRICFEHGMNFFLETVVGEYPFYHSALSNAVSLVLFNGFCTDELYIELCKRKNLIYLGEMWHRQGVDITEISKLLDNDFTLEELYDSIGKGRMLIDFFYAGVGYTEDGGDVPESREKSDCLAFTVTSNGDIKLHRIAKGAMLEENIQSTSATTDFFRTITNRLLGAQQGIETLIVCADGDFNRISFAGLPHQNGYITDYYAVRNIGSVLDVVYPNRKKPIKSALLFTSPDLGEAKGGGRSWQHLVWSELEGKMIAYSLSKKLDISTEHFSGLNANREALLNNIGNGHGVLHISTHGTVIEGNVAILAAGANLSLEDSLVLDSEIASQNLTNTSLVVFAVCYGAEQTINLQDSLSGFIKSSLLTGANSIIAPIKPVDDLSSTILLNEFYKFYLSEKESCAGNAEQSLRKAIQRLRSITNRELLREYFNEYGIGVSKKEKHPFSDPIYWASWVCFSKEELEG